MWVWIVIGAALVIFLLVLACLRMAKQSEEQYFKAEMDRKLDTLFACAHLVVQVEVHGLKQLLKNQGCGKAVMDAIDQDTKGIHDMIDSNHQQAIVNKLEANFYLNNEKDYQNMLKTLVGYMSDIDGYEEGQKLLSSWTQLHDSWISEHKVS